MLNFGSERGEVAPPKDGCCLISVFRGAGQQAPHVLLSGFNAVASNLQQAIDDHPVQTTSGSRKALSLLPRPCLRAIQGG